MSSISFENVAELNYILTTLIKILLMKKFIADKIPGICSTVNLMNLI